jgi:predicted DNA-binding transcriptional regulator AlpA
VSLTPEFKELIFIAVAQFRWLNRNKSLSRADKKQLKTFFLEQLIAPHVPNPAQRNSNGRASAGRTPKNRIVGQQMLTAKEVEAWLRIDRKTIYLYVQKRLIPHLRLEGNVRFPALELQQWVRRHSYPPRDMKAKHAPRQLRTKRKPRAHAR